jgi:glyoxylase-like metal-dependent hydrolase (beta-lactamase superfamily II)
MHATIQKWLSLLPADTLIWPGHEYALSNLTFARELEPGNIFLQVLMPIDAE